jgi:hypothetical protein
VENQGNKRLGKSSGDTLANYSGAYRDSSHSRRIILHQKDTQEKET